MPKSRRVILIAGEDAMTADLGQVLRETEHVVVPVRGNGTALDAVTDCRPDVIVVDISASSDDLDAVPTMKALIPGTKLICLSTNPSIVAAKRALRQGASGYLLKACARLEIVAAVDNALRGMTYFSRACSQDQRNHLRPQDKGLAPKGESRAQQSHNPLHPMVKDTIADLTGVSDDQLMMHLNAGFHDALAVLFDRYHRLVFSVALKILRDRGEAEDVMQNVFLDIFRSMSLFDPDKGTLRVWILQYAYHRAINRRHYLNARRFYAQEQMEKGEIPLSANSWFVRYSMGELKQLIQQGLSILSQKEKRVIELVSYEGFSMREIADKTGESLVNVRHHYYRGLRKVRSFIDQPMGVHAMPRPGQLPFLRGNDSSSVRDLPA
jgi:RNA polymerase sigma-70 factor (ECF subfamily)